MRSADCHFTSDGFIPACTCSKLITPVSRVSGIGLGPLARISRGVLAPDLREGLSLSAFVCKAKQTFLLWSLLQEGTSNSIMIISLLESVFTTGPSNNILGIFQPSVTKKSPQFCHTRELDEVHVGLRVSLTCKRMNRNLAASIGVPEGNYQEQPPMRTAYPSIT